MRNPKERLSRADIRKILHLHYEDHVSAATIELIYPVSLGTIYGILRGTAHPVPGFDYSRYSGSPAPHNQKRTAEAVTRAKEMRAEGATYKAIGEALGVTPPTAREWALR